MDTVLLRCAKWLREHAEEFESGKICDIMMDLADEEDWDDGDIARMVKFLREDVGIVSQPEVRGITLPTLDDYALALETFTPPSTIGVCWTKDPDPKDDKSAMSVVSGGIREGRVGVGNCSVCYQPILKLKPNTAEVGDWFYYGYLFPFVVISPDKALSVYGIGYGSFGKNGSMEYEGSYAEDRMNKFLVNGKAMMDLHKDEM